MRCLLTAIIILVLLTGCQKKKTSIFSDEFVTEKCANIVKTFECWFDGDTMKWLEQTQWELVSIRHKDIVVETMSKCISHYSSDFMKVFTLGYMDPNYSFPRMARFRNSRDMLTRVQVAESIPLKGKYKESSIRIMVQLLFDTDANVRTSVACVISRRLDKSESMPLLLLHYFENAYGQSPTFRDIHTDCVRTLAASEYRGVLVSWLGTFKTNSGKDPVKGLELYDFPQNSEYWWVEARAEEIQTIAKGRKIADEMRKKYIYDIKRSPR